MVPAKVNPGTEADQIVHTSIKRRRLLDCEYVRAEYASHRLGDAARVAVVG
jgi:hypothetical protein